MVIIYFKYVDFKLFLAHNYSHKNVVSEEKMNSVEKINLNNAADTPIVRDLKGLLNCFTASDLRYALEMIKGKKFGKISKKKLVMMLYEMLTNVNELNFLISQLVDNELKLLQRIVLNNGVLQDNGVSIEDYHILYMFGIVFLFRRGNKFYISMPTDVYEVMKDINIDDFIGDVKENTKIYEMYLAMIRLYGVITIDDLINAYNFYYGEVDRSRVTMLLSWERLDSFGTLIDGKMYYVANILHDEDFWDIRDEIIERQKEIPCKRLSLEELLKYRDFDYFDENIIPDDFIKYLKGKNVSDAKVDSLLFSICNHYKLGHEYVATTFEMLINNGIDIKEDELQMVLDYLISIYNNTRLWTNHGWTPIELRDEMVNENI